MTPRNRARALTVDALVRQALGKRYEQASLRERRRLIRRFIEAGRHAIRTESGTARQAAEALAAAIALRGKALRALAARTAPGHEPVVTDPKWRDRANALAGNKARMDTHPDVRGYGLSFRRRAGQELAEPCVTVLVPKKLPREDLKRRSRRAIPQTMVTSGGKHVPVDVLEVGELRRQFTAGSSLGPPSTQIKGTIGAWGVTTESGAAAALTAMHVAKGHSRFVVPSPRDASFGEPLGEFLRGTLERVDAALIGVEPPATAEPFMQVIGPIRGWRPVAVPADRSAEVRMFGAASGFRRGFIIEPAMTFPNFGLDHAIVVDIQTADGDSGAAIVDSENLVLGLLVGETELGGFPVRLFSPISLILGILGCDLATG